MQVWSVSMCTAIKQETPYSVQDIQYLLQITAVPTGTPTNVQVVAISSSSIRLTWEPPRPEDQNGIIMAYNITITEAETGRVTYFRKEGTGSLLIVNFLHPFYTYQCSISAETIGPGPPALASITTHQEGKV